MIIPADIDAKSNAFVCEDCIMHIEKLMKLRRETLSIQEELIKCIKQIVSLQQGLSNETNECPDGESVERTRSHK